MSYTDTSLLTEGMILKNYKAVCKKLGESVLDGTSKKAQIKRWKSYFDWKNDKQSWIIEKIYFVPLALPEKPKNLNGYCGVLILIDLMNEIDPDASDDDNTFAFRSYSDLKKIMCLVNRNYDFGKNLVEKTGRRTKAYDSFFPNIALTNAREFYNDVEQIYRDSIKAAIIFLHKIYALKAEDSFLVKYKENNHWEPSSIELDLKIRAALNDTLLKEEWLPKRREMEGFVEKIPTERDIMLSGKSSAFYADVCKHPKLEPYGIERFAKGYKFSFDNDMPKRAVTLEKFFPVEQEYRDIMNKHVQERLYKQSIDRLGKQPEKLINLQEDPDNDKSSYELVKANKLYACWPDYMDDRLYLTWKGVEKREIKLKYFRRERQKSDIDLDLF